MEHFPGYPGKCSESASGQGVRRVPVWSTFRGPRKVLRKCSKLPLRTGGPGGSIPGVCRGPWKVLQTAVWSTFRGLRTIQRKTRIPEKVVFWGRFPVYKSTPKHEKCRFRTFAKSAEMLVWALWAYPGPSEPASRDRQFGGSLELRNRVPEHSETVSQSTPKLPSGQGPKSA